ncbi:phloem protein 2-A1 [Artemisia annua]|uniref:Phloem protein 2-A1 n=1 Tax=Artemisia annua TaxID=35608 RepID=A0A2U1NK83_ARTAN|nr:phloem protein 2-A1 [Artemisia annua]
MGSRLSREANRQQSEASPTKNTSQTHEKNHNTKTVALTTSTLSNNLPHEFEAIIKDADTVIDKSSIDKLYDGVFLNKKRKKYWVDKASNDNSFMVFARDLSITWGEDSRYWHWPYIKETSEEVLEVAELLAVCWLEVNGKFEISKLTPGIKYEVVFVVMLNDRANGWEVPINIRLVLPDGSKQEHKENIMEKPRSKWFEIPVGEFMVGAKKGGFVEFSLYQQGINWKKGLLVKGVAIRPKI